MILFMIQWLQKLSGKNISNSNMELEELKNFFF